MLQAVRAACPPLHATPVVACLPVHVHWALTHAFLDIPWGCMLQLLLAVAPLKQRSPSCLPAILFSKPGGRVRLVVRLGCRQQDVSIDMQERAFCPHSLAAAHSWGNKMHPSEWAHPCSAHSRPCVRRLETQTPFQMMRCNHSNDVPTLA